MARFQKTRIHPATAVLFLFGLYCLAGLAYAASAGSSDAVVVWAIVGVLAFIASFAYQRYVIHRRSRREG